MIDQIAVGVIIGLATWRLAYAITNEDIFKWLRQLFGVRVEPDIVEEFGVERNVMKTVQKGDTPLLRAVGTLLSCVYCASFWVGVTFYLLWDNYPNIIWVFAIGGVAALIQDWRTR